MSHRDRISWPSVPQPPAQTSAKEVLTGIFRCTICLSTSQLPVALCSKCFAVIGCIPCIEQWIDVTPTLSKCPLCRTSRHDNVIPMGNSCYSWTGYAGFQWAKWYKFYLLYILEQLMNHDLREIQTWLIPNKLSLNVIKTKYMIVASQYRTKHLEHQFNIQVDHKSLVRDETYKYLGCWNRSIINLERSCRQNC